jgi:hypothetical protein
LKQSIHTQKRRKGPNGPNFATWRTGIQTKPQLETPGLGRVALLAMTRARRREVLRGDRFDRAKSCAGREGLTTKRNRPEMAPQCPEKIESAPGNGMGSEASNPQDLVRGRVADRARLRLTSRNHEVAEKGAKGA